MAIGEVKYCPQCGKIVSKNDKFCQKCGALTDLDATSDVKPAIQHKKTEDEKIKETIAELDKKVKKRAAGLSYPDTDTKKENRDESESNLFEKKKNYLLIFSWVVIVLSVMFILYFVAVNLNDKPTDNGSNNPNTEIKDRDDDEINKEIQTTNPAYLLTPDQFIVEEGVSLIDTAEDGKSVWVEDVIDENTIKISYVEHSSNRNKLKFSQIELAGLSDFDNELFHCNPKKLTPGTVDTRLKQAEESSGRFLTTLLKEKNIFLKTPGQKPDCEKIEETESIKRYVMTSVDNIPAEHVSKIKGIEDNTVNINRALINLGYGKVSSEDVCLLLNEVFLTEMNEAEDASEGTWADCLFYYNK